MRAVLAHNLGLAISLALLLAGALVSAALALLTMRAGLSPRGIVFFAVFFAAIVLPQVAGHLALAVRPPQAARGGEPLVPALQPLVRLFRAHALLQVASVLGLVAAVAWWFFAGTAWAARVPAAAGVAPLTAAALTSRLQAIDQAGLPIAVDTWPDGRIAVTWRPADARRLQRTHRLLLRLDEAAHRVLATEQSSALDAGAGPGAASLRWRTELGLTFFQIDHRRPHGLQFGPDGRAAATAGHVWHFSVDELKAPLIAAVAAAGWDWQPAVLAGALPWARAAQPAAPPAQS